MTIQFRSPDEIFAHYAAVKARLSVVPRTLPKQQPDQHQPIPSFASSLRSAPGPRTETLRGWRAHYRGVVAGMPPYLRANRGRDAIVRAMWESGMTWRDVSGSSRVGDVVRCRQTVMWLVRKFRPKYGLARIAQCVGRMDHTTALWAIKKTEVRIQAGEISPKLLYAATREAANVSN